MKKEKECDPRYCNLIQFSIRKQFKGYELLALTVIIFSKMFALMDIITSDNYQFLCISDFINLFHTPFSEPGVLSSEVHPEPIQESHPSYSELDASCLLSLLQAE